MLDNLKLKNPDIKLYSVNSEEFKTFGRVITGLDTSEIIKAAEKISRPAEGSAYTPSEESFEKLSIAKETENKFFGTLPAQIGYCHGHNSLLNAAEWHMSSEINIAVTPLVLILGHIWDIKSGKTDLNFILIDGKITPSSFNLVNVPNYKIARDITKMWK